MNFFEQEEWKETPLENDITNWIPGDAG